MGEINWLCFLNSLNWILLCTNELVVISKMGFLPGSSMPEFRTSLRCSSVRTEPPQGSHSHLLAATEGCDSLTL